jgi:cell division protein FtsL
VKRIFSVGAIAVLIPALVASSLLLITAQQRARGLFVQLEREQQTAQQLQADGNRLRIELGRVSQPANVEAAALALGLRRIDMARTAFLPTPRQPVESGR